MSFALHALVVGGGWLALSRMPGRGGDFHADLAIILDWRPDLVVSMTQAPEMAPAKDLPLALMRAGVRWAHFPVSDYGIPDDSGDRIWPDLSSDLHAVLGRGGRVLLHCMGGCGRSGMLALRAMIEGGEAPGDALVRLRATRPCAVETEAQMAWALRR